MRRGSPSTETPQSEGQEAPPTCASQVGPVMVHGCVGGAGAAVMADTSAGRRLRRTGQPRPGRADVVTVVGLDGTGRPLGYIYADDPGDRGSTLTHIGDCRRCISDRHFAWPRSISKRLH